MIKSPICELLQIKYPIFQGGMAWISDGKLAASVSNAGGLGIISAICGGVEKVKEEIAIAKKLTKNPFGVNIMLMDPEAEKIAQLVIDEGIKVVTTGAGSPVGYMEQWKNANIAVIPVIASVTMAKRMEKAGAVAVVAEGEESGGHIGELTTMALVPQVAQNVSIPVIAAGGIYDGHAMAASFMMGALGVQMGTRFLSATECGVHPKYKEMLLKANDTATVTTGRRFNGATCRCLKNPFSREFKSIEYLPETTAEDISRLGIGALKKAVVDGNTKEGSFLAGQISGMVVKEESASDIVLSVVKEAENCFMEAPKWVK